MQCLSCGFENLPGLTACGRCASPLDLRAVGVQPPRAGRLRIATRTARAAVVAHRLGVRLPRGTFVRRLIRAIVPERLDVRALLLTIVPGLGQKYTQRPMLGRAILCAWLGLLALLILSLGTTWQSLCFMLMAAVHTLAFVEVLTANLCWGRPVVRLLFGLLLFGGVFQGLYRPARWAATRFADAVPITTAPRNGLLRAGDGLLVAGPWLRPVAFARGDIVLYELTCTYVNHYYIRDGVGVDRIVGVPGDHIELCDGRLLVNGAPPAPDQAPLFALDGLGEFKLDVVVPRDTYAIVPTLFAAQGNAAQWRQIPEPLQRHLVIVPHRQVTGHVLLRLRPLRRFGSLGP